MTRKKKSKADDQHEDTHRWIVSYADFITLLFAFFVVMYAISSVNISKYKSLSEGLNSAFNEKDKHRSIKQTSDEADGPVDLKSLGGDKQNFDAMNLALSRLQDSTFKVNNQDGWLSVDMKAAGMFQSGSAEINAVAMIKLMEVADAIKGFNYPIFVEGYTDNIPITSPQFPSNWDLSAARAATIGRILFTFGVNPNRITVIGYGERYPVADNSTAEGRAENRRVLLVIAKDKKVNRLLNPSYHENGNSLVVPK